MSTAIWTVLAVAAMLGIFAFCVGVVVIVLRALEAALFKRQRTHGS
jgi:hypothetical protein